MRFSLRRTEELPVQTPFPFSQQRAIEFTRKPAAGGVSTFMLDVNELLKVERKCVGFLSMKLVFRRPQFGGP